MYDITDFTIRQMAECGKCLRTMGKGAATMEEVARQMVRHFYDELVDGDGKRACSLVRFYKTHPYRMLDARLQGIARKLMGSTPDLPDMKCLVLLATAGEEPEWNIRQRSQDHQAIPLPSEEAISQAPMVHNLILQLGLNVSMLAQPDPSLLLDLAQRTYNVFYVPQALDSPHIPAQDAFVIPYGIESVLGFGGMLPSGEMFAIVMFLKVPVSQEIATLFKPLSLNVKMGILSFEKAVFSEKGSGL